MAKIVIIGGGVAGLSAGIYARAHGHEAIVCEKHNIAGGNLTGWSREGCRIDNCIHWLTGTNPNTPAYQMWRELGALGGVGIHQPNSLFTCEINGERLSLYRDLHKLKARMLEISPEDERETLSFIKAVNDLQGFMGIEGERHSEKNSLFQKIKAVPTLVKYFNLTIGDLSARFRHPLIREFFVSFFTDRFGAIALLFVIAHFCADNAGIPEGGSVAMARRMSDRFSSLGGQLLLRKEAVKINYENGRASSVSFSDGSVISFDYIILTTDPAATFGKILDSRMPRQLRSWYGNRKMMRFSSYQCAFKCDLPSLPFESDISIKLSFGQSLRLCARSLVVREFSHEPSFAPEGYNLLQTMIFCDEKTSRKFIELRATDRTEYNKRKSYLAEWIKRAIVEKIPELDGHLECIDVWTPATYKRFVGSDMGSYMSFVFSKRFLPLVAKSTVKGIDNLLLATQWQQAPGGLPIAAELGRRAVEAITKILKKPRRARA